VDCEVDAIQISVQQFGLLSIEGEAFEDEPILNLLPFRV